MPTVSNGTVTISRCVAPCSGIPSGATLVALASNTQAEPVAITPFDLTEEPDVLPDDSTISSLFERQSTLFQTIAANEVMVQWEAAGQTGQSIVTPVQRPWLTLPAMFWFQLGVATLGCLIAAWVWVLRQHDCAARIFGLSGLMFPVFAMAAAIYSTRELAISGELFARLSLVNHFGALVYGAAFAGIFLAHPRQLARSWVFIALPLLAIVWWGLGATGVITDPDLTIRYPTLIEMLAALVLAILQWVLSRRQALDRAALRWLLLSFLIGGGLFIGNHVVTSLLGHAPLIPQGYAFGFFLLIYLGIALGLRRYRLFDLDIIAWRVLMVVGALLSVLVIDVLFITWLGWSESVALGSSVWIVALVYLLGRQWLWEKLTRRGKLRLDTVLPELIDVAFEPSVNTRNQRWRTLLTQLYQPTEIRALLDNSLGGQGQSAEIANHGIEITVPACARLSGYHLMHRDHGRRLFSPYDAALLNAMRNLLERAEHGRIAHETAVQNERKRIARDLHDDVGASLLMLIHRAPSADIRDLARSAMSDLRSALSAIDGEDLLLSHCLANIRAEASMRCDAAGVEMVWQAVAPDPEPTLDGRKAMVLTRGLRECLSNCFKHAMSTPLNVVVSSHWDAACASFSLTCTNNGTTLASPPHKGRGLTGLESRLKELGGRMELALNDSGFSVTMTLPLLLSEGN